MTYGQSAALRVWDTPVSNAAFTAELTRIPGATQITSAATYDPSEGSVAAWLPVARDVLNELRELRKNWDSYGAEPISPAMIVAASKLLQQISPAKTPMPSIVPTPDGSVQLEWHTRGIDLEIRFLSVARLAVTYVDAAHPERDRDFDLAFDLTPLQELVSELLSRGRLAGD